MPAANNARRDLRRSQTFIRVSSLLFFVFGLVLGLMGSLLAFGASALEGDSATLARGLGIACLAVAAWLVVTAILGLRAAHNSYKVGPYLVFSVVVAVCAGAWLLLTKFSIVTDSFADLSGGSTTSFVIDVLLVVFCVMAIGSIIAALSLRAYNKRHPEGEAEIPPPAYMPESLARTAYQQSAAATPAAAKESEESIMQDTTGTEALELRLSGHTSSILHKKVDVLDAHDNVIYRISTKAMSMHDITQIHDANDNLVAEFHMKLFSLHHIYYIEMANGTKFEMSREITHLKDVIDIEALGWQLHGENMLEFNFEVVDEAGTVLARAHRPAMSLHDVYAVTVLDESHTDEIVAIFAVMKHMVDERISDAAVGGGASAIALGAGAKS